MSRRTRNCVECLKCHTRYVVAVSRYANGSCLMIDRSSGGEDYVLYCSCANPAHISRWSWRELARYWVPNDAYARGFGSPREIVRRLPSAS